MKKSAFLFSFVLLSCLQLAAQTEKGTGFIGVNFDNVFSIRQGTLTGGYFFTDNFALGLNTNIGVGIGSNGDGVEGSDLNLGAGFFGRYYFPSKNNEFRVFGEAEFGLNRNYLNTNNSSNWSGFEYSSLGLGVAYFISPQFSLEASTRLRLTNYNENVRLYLGDIDFGLKYFFGGKKKN
ncbi:MAG: hypothetical protein R2788_12530 [Saprospiraceae bacterium]